MHPGAQDGDSDSNIPGHPRLRLSCATLEPTFEVEAIDEQGQRMLTRIAGEHPLTLYVDRREIVTLMTLGRAPEALAIGYLRNQRLVRSIAEIESVQVDWDVNAVAVTTHAGIDDLERRMSHRTVTTGCGQGTVCALLAFVEDVGRHNAVDAIAGQMWLQGWDGADKIFYTTGRLTSEMVIKAAQMQIPFLVSRSGLTQMGYQTAQRVGMTMLGRAVNRHFLLFTGEHRFVHSPLAPA